MEKVKNRDLGRPLVFRDITGYGTYPIDESDSGHVYCFACDRYSKIPRDELEPLTQSTGVFTSDYLCEMDSPVWVCFDCLGFEDKFTDEVVQILKGK